MKKYKVEKSKFPEGNKTHLVILDAHSEHGYNYQRVFKGSYKECLEEKRRREEIENSIFREVLQ